MNSQNALNQRIKEARKFLNLSQEEVAEKTDIKRSSISKIENGLMEVPNSLILFYTRTYNISSYWLLDGQYPVYKELADAISSEDQAITDRVILLFESNGYADRDHGESQFCKQFGIDKKKFGLYIRKELSIPATVLLNISNGLDVSLDWLLTGNLNKEGAQGGNFNNNQKLTGNNNAQGGRDASNTQTSGKEDCERKLEMALYKIESLERENRTLHKVIEKLGG